MTKIVVTQDDIDRGSKHSCHNCPVALAITRALGPGVLVGKDSWRIVGSTQRNLLPEIAQQFISAFDGLSEVAPFEFEL